MTEIAKQEIEQESDALEQERRASAIITVAKVLLWMDLLLACFVYSGIRAGSHLFLWWVLGEGLLGVILLAVGSKKRAEARRELAILAPK